mgnify:CR=1 FL=1
MRVSFEFEIGDVVDFYSRLNNSKNNTLGVVTGRREDGMYHVTWADGYIQDKHCKHPNWWHPRQLVKIDL